jgi:hypothetical protein
VQTIIKIINYFGTWKNAHKFCYLYANFIFKHKNVINNFYTLLLSIYINRAKKIIGGKTEAQKKKKEL